MELRLQRDGEALVISGRLRDHTVVLDTPEGPVTATWQRLAPGEFLLEHGDTAIRCFVARHGDTYWVEIGGRIWTLQRDHGRRRGDRGGGDALRAPMPGQVVQVRVQPGQQVAKGESLLVLEAMKMQYDIVAPHAGVVETIAAREGEQVAGGVVLVRLRDDGEDA